LQHDGVISSDVFDELAAEIDAALASENITLPPSSTADE
jgi:hypothetical protein